MENIDTPADIKIVSLPIVSMESISQKHVKNRVNVNANPKKGVNAKKRVITENRVKWIFLPSDMEPESQLKMVNALKDNTEVLGSSIVLQQIRQKIYGYRMQDFAKHKYDHFLFIREKDILNMLCLCNLECYYCHNPVMLIYEDVREPRQWSIERLDNAYGHNRGNTVIACLQCNLRRRTIKTERYLLTKSIAIVNKLA